MTAIRGGNATERDSTAQPLLAVASDASARRREITGLLAAGGVTVTVRAATPEGALRRLGHAPDAVVVLSCRRGAPTASIRALQRAGARVVLVTGDGRGNDELPAALRSGVEAVVCGDQIAEALVPSVRAVFAEQVVFPREDSRRRAAPVLSRRERQVLRLAVQGCTDDEIASRLRIATETVKQQLSSALAKLAAGSRDEQAAAVAESR